jgi:signal transduction histidine kinase
VNAAGQLIDCLPTNPSGRTPVRRGDLELGMLLHDARLSERPNLLDGVLMRAGLAIEIARLRAEVRQQLAEVQGSRARLVAATDEERRRLERDLHDGAQQRLVSIGLALRHIQHVNGEDGVAVADALDGVVDDLGESIKSLRELAAGIRPAARDGGLAPALAELASGAAMETAVDATTERFEAGLEAAAFFVASEGLANSIKHSRGTLVGLRAGRTGSSLVLRVSDDGIGGAELSGGTGLASLADRVAALGGRLELESETGAGTTLTAELPCG